MSMDPTGSPVEYQAGPGPVHHLGGVVGVEGSVVEPAHRLYGHRQAAVEEQTTLVPERERGAGIERGLVDQVQRQVVLGERRLPARTMRHVEHRHVCK